VPSPCLKIHSFSSNPVWLYLASVWALSEYKLDREAKIVTCIQDWSRGKNSHQGALTITLYLFITFRCYSIVICKRDAKYIQGITWVMRKNTLILSCHKTILSSWENALAQAKNKTIYDELFEQDFKTGLGKFSDKKQVCVCVCFAYLWVRMFTLFGMVFYIHFYVRIHKHCVEFIQTWFHVDLHT
jgi:hypothetical protein